MYSPIVGILFLLLKWKNTNMHTIMQITSIEISLRSLIVVRFHKLTITMSEEHFREAFLCHDDDYSTAAALLSFNRSPVNRFVADLF